MNDHQLKLKDGYINYQTYGNGPPIIFLHGFSLDNRMWQPQVDRFRSTNTVITYDMRGFGRSSMPCGVYSHHEDLNKLLGGIGISKAHLVGLSLGGEVAIDFTLSYPDKVLSLTLLDTSLGGFEITVNVDVRAKEEGMEKARANWFDHQVFSYSNQIESTRIILRSMLTDYSGWHWVNPDTRELLSPSAMHEISKIKAPLITAVGDNDLGYYHNISDFISNKVNGSQKIIIPNAGHLSNLDNVEFVNGIITDNILLRS